MTVGAASSVGARGQHFISVNAAEYAEPASSAATMSTTTTPMRALPRRDRLLLGRGLVIVIVWRRLLDTDWIRWS